jgi:putative sigma-54 modulation protein
MQIKITGHGLEITASLRDYAQGKMSKLEEFFDNIQKVELILDARLIDNVDKRQVAEIRAWMAGHKMIQAKEAGRDMYSAIDLAYAAAKGQIERHKEKMVKEKRRKGGEKKKLAREFKLPTPAAGTSIIKLERFAGKPMNYEEALAELKSMGQDFIAFHNTESGEVNVLRRNKDDYNLLKPEKKLTAVQAVEELKKSGENILVFNNLETNSPAVIFQRKSGNFGLIEPEA